MMNLTVSSANQKRENLLGRKSLSKVCIRFIPPHPPSARSRDRKRLTSGSGSGSSRSCVGQRIQSTRREKRRDVVVKGRESAGHVIYDENLPYSHEVSYSSFSSPITTSTSSDVGGGGGGGFLSIDSLLNKRSSLTSTPTLSFAEGDRSRQTLLPSEQGTSVIGSHLDKKICAKIIKGLKYVEKRNDELSETNRNLLRELEALKHDVRQDSETKKNAIDDNLDDLKLELKKIRIENEQLQEQRLEDWKTRVKLEDDFLRLKVRLDHSTKDKLPGQCSEVEKEKSWDKKENVQMFRFINQLREKIAFLEGTIRKLNAEKQELAKENTLHRSGKHLVTHRHGSVEGVYAYSKIGSSKEQSEPRSEEVQSRNQVDCGLTMKSTPPGKLGKSSLIQIALVDEAKLLNAVANIRSPRFNGLLTEALPPITDEEGSISRRQWKNSTSVSGFN